MSNKKTKTRQADLHVCAGVIHEPRPIDPLTFFTPREHAILAEYLSLKSLRPKEAIDPSLLHPVDPVQWDEAKHGVAVLDCEDFNHSTPGPLHNAVARICLTTISNLPFWARCHGNGQITYGRPPKDPSNGPARILLTEFIGGINWATSGPGISWPESYHITRIPHYETWVITASTDTPETTGFTDWAVHHVPGTRPIQEAAKEGLLVTWSDSAQEDQGVFESIQQTGLLPADEIAAVARLVWPGAKVAAVAKFIDRGVAKADDPIYTEGISIISIRRQPKPKEETTAPVVLPEDPEIQNQRESKK